MYRTKASLDFDVYADAARGKRKCIRARHVWARQKLRMRRAKCKTLHLNVMLIWIFFAGASCVRAGLCKYPSSVCLFSAIRRSILELKMTLRTFKMTKFERLAKPNWGDKWKHIEIIMTRECSFDGCNVWNLRYLSFIVSHIFATNTVNYITSWIAP